MSERCFRISGNFMENGKWSLPDPSFIGYVIMADNGIFEGYTEELYTHPEGVDNFRFIIGKSYDEPIKGVTFTKLINEQDYAPYIYKFLDVSSEGEYGQIDPPFNVLFGGKAKITFEQTDITDDIKNKIQQIKESVLGGPEWNQLLYEAILLRYTAQ